MNRKAVEAWFNTTFWPAFPKKAGKADALNELLRMRPDAGTINAIEAGLTHRLTAEKQAKAKGLFHPAWPDPHRWLRKRRWEDRFEVSHETSGVPRCHCGEVGVVGDGRKWFCRAHDPGRRPT